MGFAVDLVGPATVLMGARRTGASGACACHLTRARGRAETPTLPWAPSEPVQPLLFRMALLPTPDGKRGKRAPAIMINNSMIMK
jgi:hypothetical protein